MCARSAFCSRSCSVVLLSTRRCVALVQNPPSTTMLTPFWSSSTHPWRTRPTICRTPVGRCLTTSPWTGCSSSSSSTSSSRTTSGGSRRRVVQLTASSRKDVDRPSSWWWFSSKTARSVALAVAVTLSLSAAAYALPTGPTAATLMMSKSPYLARLTETGFYQAFSLVFLSEIGDKTFFIAGLLSMKTSRLISFVGSIAALAAMTVVSVMIGQICHAVPAGLADGIPLDDVAAVLAFAFFGIKTLKDAFDMEEGESAMDVEFAEAETVVEGSRTVGEVTPWGQIASIFALVFAAEFGDRSFLSTIALSAAQNPVSVAGGAIAAHAAATGLAVSGGSFVAKYISERVIGFIGGTLFLVFAVTTALGIF